MQELLDVLSDKTGKSTLSSQSMLDIFQYIDYCYVDNYDEYFISDEVSSIVITSYSIHYTKLYDKRICNRIVEVA